MVVVLAIFGILLAIAFRGISSLSEAAQKAKAVSGLRTIVNAYRQYMEDTGHPIRWLELGAVAEAESAGFDVTLIAAVLAKDSYLTDIEAWVWDFDYRVRKYEREGGVMPTKICDIQRNTDGKITSAKIDTSFRGQRGFPVSVCAVVAANSCTNEDFFKNASEIPIAYSRGLRGWDTAPGTWADSTINLDRGGVFGRKGGFIAFLDGHVEWYNNLGTGNQCALKKYGTNTMTNKICETIPKGGGTVYTNSYVLSWKGGATDCDRF
jgi:type II secretory pathway pseudopilin PulG